VTVKAPAGKAVILRNISINGVRGGTLPGLNGIRFLGGGSLTLQNVNIYGFSQSCVEIAITTVGMAPITHITESNLANCTTGVTVSNTGNQRSSLNITRSTISNVTTGINGVQQANIALDNVTVSGATSVGILVNTVGAPASEVNIHHGLITMNALGLQIGSGAMARINDVYFAANGKAMDNQGTCQSAGNNKLGGNVNSNTGAACGAISQF
jgi:hypothetical protein